MTAGECLADLLMLAHACFSLFVGLGLLMILVGMIVGWRWTRCHRFRLFHLTATILVVARASTGMPCPLSVAENHIRDGMTSRCPLGQPIHDALHRLAFRGTDPHRFARSSALFGLVVLTAFVLNRATSGEHAIADKELPKKGTKAKSKEFVEEFGGNA